MARESLDDQRWHSLSWTGSPFTFRFLRILFLANGNGINGINNLKLIPFPGFIPPLPCFAMSYGSSMMNVVIVDPSTLGYYHVLPVVFIDLTYLQDSRVNLVIWPSCPLLASWTCDCPGCIGIEPNLHPLKFAWEKVPKDPKVIKLP